jgi:hypothetical protein
MLGPGDSKGDGLSLEGVGMDAWIEKKEMKILAHVKAVKNLYEGKSFKISSDNAFFSGSSYLARFAGNVELSLDNYKVHGPEAEFIYKSGTDFLQSIMVMAGAATAGLLSGPVGWAALGTAAATGLGTYALSKNWYQKQKNSAAYNAAAAYKKNLFSEKGVGLPLDADPWDESIPLSKVADAYFRTKYLYYNLNEDDPLHVPLSQEVTGFLRNCHQAIIDRAQKSMNYALAHSSDIELEKLRAMGMNVDVNKLKSLTIGDRMQLIHAYLQDSEYIKANEKIIRKRAEQAYKPVKDHIDHERHRKDALVNATTNLLYRKPYSVAKLFGIPLVLKTLYWTWPKKVITKTSEKVGNAEKKISPYVTTRSMIGAALGTIAFPIVGTAIGGYIGAKSSAKKEPHDSHDHGHSSGHGH